MIESVRDHPRTAVRSCHDTGKTAIAARAAMWFLSVFPRSRVITTAPTGHQVKNLLWREIHAAAHAVGGLRDAELTDTQLELAPDWFAVGLSTNEPERFAGHHAEHVLLIVDEASGVGQGIYDAAEGSLASEHARVLLIGNPTRTSGEFFNAFHRDRAMWNLIDISAFDTPAFTGEDVSPVLLRRLVTPRWVEEKRAKWGVSSPLYQVRVLGRFPEASDDTVCSLGDVETAQARQLEPELPVVVACDVARFGSDETVIALRRGNRVRVVEAYGGRDTMQTVGRILRVAREAKSLGDWPVIVVDDAGVGGGVTDRLRELQREGRLGLMRVVAFNGANRARAEDDYPNRRSEAWFELVGQLAELDLDPDEQLAADLLAPRYVLDSAARRVVERKDETKKRLGRSPDRGDAVVMAFAHETRASTSSAEVVTDADEWRENPLEMRRAGAGSMWASLRGEGGRALDSLRALQGDVYDDDDW